MSKETARALQSLRNALRDEPPGEKAHPQQRLEHAKDEAAKEAVMLLVGAALDIGERIAIALEKIANAPVKS